MIPTSGMCGDEANSRTDGSPTALNTTKKRSSVVDFIISITIRMYSVLLIDMFRPVFSVYVSIAIALALILIAKVIACELPRNAECDLIEAGKAL